MAPRAACMNRLPEGGRHRYRGRPAAARLSQSADAHGKSTGPPALLGVVVFHFLQQRPA